MKNKEIEELLNNLNKKLKNYELDKKIGQLSVDSIYHLFPNEIQLLLSYIEQLEECYCNRTDCIGRIKDSKKYDSLLQKYKQLENNRDKAIEVINTQLKNAEGGMQDNLRIIKFNLIKGSCTFEDLKTEEDYKYILKGDNK